MTRTQKPFSPVTVINLPAPEVDNRLSSLQADILDFLKSEGATGPRPGGMIGHLPTTGAVVDGVGRDRDKVG